jgi:uncharacterized damage-inducible protein DinB
MREIVLSFPAGYDRQTQAMVGLFAAQLDDLLRRLKKGIEGLSIEQLEWQPRPGMNSIGVLLTHTALTEAWWINVAAAGIPMKPDGQKLIDQILGMDNGDDGMPLPPDGKHPAPLTGKTLAEYIAMLERARAAVHGALQKWSDADLEAEYTLEDAKFTRSWTLYHVLEHFATHYGQVLMLKHLMRDAGILPKA